jgi:hypothetical protein
VPICASCGRESEGDFAFCPYCGAELGSVPRAREQRKTVTVLFCDVTGSTALGESTDPEALRRGHRHHLGDEQGVPAGGAGDLPAQVGCEALRDQLVDVCFRQRLEPERDRPLRAALGEFGSSEAEDEDRRGGRKQGKVLDEDIQWGEVSS